MAFSYMHSIPSTQWHTRTRSKKCQTWYTMHTVNLMMFWRVPLAITIAGSLFFFCSCFFCVYVSYRMHFITYSAINKFCVIFARIYRAHKFQFGWYLSVFMHVYLPTRNKWLWQNKQTTINTLNEIYAIKYIVLSIQQNIVKNLNKTNIIELCIQCCWLTNL